MTNYADHAHHTDTSGLGKAELRQHLDAAHWLSTSNRAHELPLLFDLHATLHGDTPPSQMPALTAEHEQQMRDDITTWTDTQRAARDADRGDLMEACSAVLAGAVSDGAGSYTGVTKDEALDYAATLARWVQDRLSQPASNSAAAQQAQRDGWDAATTLGDLGWHDHTDNPGERPPSSTGREPLFTREGVSAVQHALDEVAWLLRYAGQAADFMPVSRVDRVQLMTAEAVERLAAVHRERDGWVRSSDVLLVAGDLRVALGLPRVP